ncbi:MAG: hypothetical protein JWP25_5073 [Bradyrhizobium sp.]|jgi:hypothetical protein|nr:hypothetical protein [Bradyrhizobium sp.]
MSAATATVLFWIYAAVMGLSPGGTFLVFTGASIARVFFITAATYAAMSLYGYSTRSDLSGVVPPDGTCWHRHRVYRQHLCRVKRPSSSPSP